MARLVPRNRGASFTAAAVAVTRSELSRPTSMEGDEEAGRRLAATLDVPRFVQRAPLIRRYLFGRTRYFDQAVIDATQAPGAVVIVGAGYDDRSMRFRTTGVQFIEVDHPTTQNDKLQRLERLGMDASDIRFVAADLAKDRIEQVLDNLVPPGALTILCEAVIPYLRKEQAGQLLWGLGGLNSSTTTLHLDAPVVSGSPVERIALLLLRAGTAAYSEPIHTVLPAPELEDLIVSSGWREHNRRTGSELGVPRLIADSYFLELTRATNEPTGLRSPLSRNA